jgi:hypothetical protein
MILLITSVVFILEFLVAYQYVSSKVSLILGCILMMFLSFSIFFSVKLFLSDNHPVLGPIVLLAKAPILITFIYLIFQWSKFDIVSFVVGVLILLPCLVIVSYRKI